jgi:hypothetical protein
VRDDFSIQTRETLAKRVGYRCSNPTCNRPTSGPHENPAKVVNIGVAAHITAASPSGPRYDASLTPEERGSIANGVWLCQTCAKLVDNDIARYPADILRHWKHLTEAAIYRQIENPQVSLGPDPVFAKLEKIMPQLLAEMRDDLSHYPLRREFVILRRGWSYWPGGDELCYFLDDHPELISQIQILENHGLVRDITHTNVDRYIISEKLAEYLEP